MMESQPLQEPTATATATGAEPAGAPPAVVSSLILLAVPVVCPVAAIFILLAHMLGLQEN